MAETGDREGGTAGSLQGPFNYCVCSRNQPAWGLPLRQWGGSGPAHGVSSGKGSQESGTSCDLASWTKVVHHLVRLRADFAGTPERAGQHDCPSGSHFGQVARVARQPPGSRAGRTSTGVLCPVQPAGTRRNKGGTCLRWVPSLCLLWLLLPGSRITRRLHVHLRAFIQTPLDSRALQQLCL